MLTIDLKISTFIILNINRMKTSSSNNFLATIFLFCFITGGIFAQQKTIAERLGYSSETKLLIIHADDLGVTHSENLASIRALEESPVNSASIMVPCPWFPEIAAYAREHSSPDLGLHLTLTSEWKYYKWGPVTSRDSVSSLVDANGHFHPLVPDFAAKANANEVELELRNQVKMAYRNGIDVTHLDAHMGAAVSTPEFTLAYLKVGREFELPVLLDARIHAMQNSNINQLLDENTVVMDNIYTILPDDFKNGSSKYYTELFQTMKPGISSLLIHLAYNDSEMQGVTVDHPEWGSLWRQADFDFFMSPECKKLLKDNNIVLVTWRELRDKITRGK